MKVPPTFSEIEGEFNVSFGYILGDMKAICRGTETINYTLALLIACACEMLAAARNDRDHPEVILAEVIAPQWKPLAKKLFEAFRNGLAHSFDTKHILVHDIPLPPIAVTPQPGSPGSPRPLMSAPPESLLGRRLSAERK